MIEATKTRMGTLAFLIFVAALIPRIFCILQVESGFLRDFLPLDSEFYDNWAMKIVQSGFWQLKTEYPGASLYPQWLSLIYSGFGHHFLAVRIAQAVLGSLTTVFLCLLAHQISGSKKFSAFVFLTAALFSLSIFYELWILSESLAAFLLSAFTFIFIDSQKKPSAAKGLVSGCLMGLLIAVKPNFTVLFGAILMGSLFLIKGETPAKKRNFIFSFLLAVFGMLLPAAIQNYVLSGNPLPFRPDAGIVFYESNGPYSDGRSHNIPFLPDDKLGVVKRATELAEKAAGKKLSLREVSDYWYAKTWEHFKDNPAAVFKIQLIKMRLLVSGFEMPDIYSLSLLRQYVPALNFFPLNFFFLIPLAAAGVVLVFRKNKEWNWALLILCACAASLFYASIQERFKMPIYPLILLFAAAGIGGLLDASISVRRKILAASVFCILLLLSLDKPFVAKYQGNPDAGYNFLGWQAMQHNDYDKAILFFEQALKTTPFMHRPVLHTSLGTAHSKAGHRAEAAAEYEKALKLNPTDSRARNQLARLYIKLD